MGKTELKVGLLVVASFFLVGYMSLKLAKGVGAFTSVDKHQIELNDASGLIENTAVKVAGVKVGTVEKIDLIGGRAIVTISVKPKLGLTKSAYAEIRTDGILGSKHIALFNGDPKDPAIVDGDPMSVVAAGGSISTVLTEVSKVAESLSEIADAMKSATVTGTVETPIGRIITNIELLTEDLAEISSANKGKINGIINRIDGVSSTLEQVLGDANRARINQGVDNALSGLERFDAALENIESVTNKIDKGEGTIGKLINDEETVNGVNTAIENLNSLLGRARTLRTSIDYHSEFLTENSDVKSYIGVKLQPGLDRYYDIQVVQDPLGVEKTTKIVRTGTQTDDFEEVITRKNKIKLTALFAKNFYDFTLKGGLIESTGGFGVDYNMFDGKLKLSAELFDFDDTNLKVFARWDFYHGMYLVAGANSLLSDEKDLRSPFFGGGIFLTNEDLKTLAAFAL